jgi:hypothetical protein
MARPGDADDCCWNPRYLPVKPSIIFLILIAAAAFFWIAFTPKLAPLRDVPQSERCEEICQRRDTGSIRISNGATKNEIRKLLGDPQNIDQDGGVWLWLWDWTNHEKSGLPRDWRTMVENSSGKDGLWIGFDAQGRACTPLWSLSAATPPASDDLARRNN